MHGFDEETKCHRSPPRWFYCEGSQAAGVLILLQLVLMCMKKQAAY